MNPHIAVQVMSTTKGMVWLFLGLAFFSNILYMAGLAALQVRPYGIRLCYTPKHAGRPATSPSQAWSLHRASAAFLGLPPLHLMGAVACDAAHVCK
jgi:hypothetical protein